MGPMQTIREGEAYAMLSHLRQLEIGRELQARLVEFVELARRGKQLHWSVVGPDFQPLHLQLDELVTAWRALADTIDERAGALGDRPHGQAETVAETILIRVVTALEQQLSLPPAQSPS
jgi:DNA-binding ferritin-like protein